MNFGEALEAVKRGNYIARRGWNGKGMYVFLTPSTVTKHEGSFTKVQGHLWMYTAQGELQPGWLASQSDMLADDWELVTAKGDVIDPSKINHLKAKDATLGSPSMPKL